MLDEMDRHNRFGGRGDEGRRHDKGRPRPGRQRGPGGFGAQRSSGPPHAPRKMPQAPQGAQQPATPAPATSWEHVAAWYDKLVGDAGSDYHRNVILPAAIELLAPLGGGRIMDLCCGQGVLCRLLARQGAAAVVGVDASQSLIDSARQRTSAAGVQYVVADAAALGALADGSFDAVACIMAIHDLADLPAVMAGMAAALKPGGRAVLVLMHPCFRIPRQSSWGFDDKLKIQYRRLDRYASPMAIPISTHPGEESQGKPAEHTMFFHRPLEAYINALGGAGLAVVACRELVSHRASEPGPRSRAENRARDEFPMFLALKAVKLKEGD